jgi:hypothetical protein
MVETESVLVFNPRSGKGREEIPYKDITQLWPTSIAMISILHLSDHPEMVKDKKLIGWGGDGTHGYLANLARRQNCDWYMPLDQGSIGDIPKSFGWRKETHESDTEYIARTAEKVRQGVDVIEISPGSMIAGKNEWDFLWTAGAGAAAELLSGIETARSWGWRQLPRNIYGITEFIKATQKSSLDINFPDGQNSRAIDVNIINWPFARFGSLTLPTNEGVVWWIEKANENEVWRKSIRIALDVMMMKAGKPPVYDGITFRSISQGESVRVKGNVLKTQVDSEIVPVNEKEIYFGVAEKDSLRYRIATNR